MGWVEILTLFLSHEEILLGHWVFGNSICTGRFVLHIWGFTQGAVRVIFLTTGSEKVDE